jgi:hypothetical protein
VPQGRHRQETPEENLDVEVVSAEQVVVYVL